MSDSPSDPLADPGLARVNDLPPEAFRVTFAQCLNVERWVEALLAERPYTDRPALFDAADRHARGVTDDEVDAALARHPRIGEKARGSGQESAWSRGEQARFGSTGGSTASGEDEFQRAQVAYEARFARIYLVCASGRTREDLLGDLRSRLDNDPATERRVVADELRKIALLRIGKALDSV
ncbi:2-oxo-4-hydroxy-4-carboxy-5-ureidoimidazoline decarboxylase [Spiractinospora alimapuensis]|uniref:2-oxo-4-hydroxy-4-carboxy-5-ureidoimidazoline decarboxylase n=1 Tax=Spiractinospora alimapuensis TaxID=2820884 RepID=UPI001F3A52B0|nr:2-oxo-4-hydroxy-4-carboxy-5-ureidoimidazoline decarboxylase [Spiractinospora alimapuensis]QVQ51813.1 2-oxo-4-hydroxy-4-carboxy-5-ureidoimidazoline decarboxylase [Spiractinospora alimapuensis]